MNDTNSATEKAHLADQIACEQHNTPLLAKVATEKARQARDLYALQEADLQIKRALRYADEAGQPTIDSTTVRKWSVTLGSWSPRASTLPIRKILKTK